MKLQLVSGEGGADEDGADLQRRLQGPTRTEGAGAGRLLCHGAVHHRPAGGGETASGGDGVRWRHGGWRPRPEVAVGGGEWLLRTEGGEVSSLLRRLLLHETSSQPNTDGRRAEDRRVECRVEPVCRWRYDSSSVSSVIFCFSRRRQTWERILKELIPTCRKAAAS